VLEKLPGIREKFTTEQEVRSQLQQQIPSRKPEKYQIEQLRDLTPVTENPQS